jgi:phosphate/sulfate permease
MDIYLLLVVVLLIFAVADIILGVGNDAVNFLGPAIGSKAASFRVIIAVAAVGILIGAMTAGEMMEIARSGIFVPGMFRFRDIMWIFVGVVVADTLLFNTFNSLGLPTSTSVSIVFELLGGSVAMALVNLNSGHGTADSVMSFINTGNVLTIVSAILLSIVFAFFFGYITQWISRLLFTFNYKKQMMRFGSLFGGIATTIISYFLIIKGLKQSNIISAERLAFIQENTMMILLICFAFWTVLIAICRKLFKMDVLKFVVLAGTFALALAFAGNDLVNFIGVSLAGLNSYQVFKAQGGVDDTFSMDSLSSAATGDTNLPIYLFIIGILMIFSLWLARKGAVTKTTLSLSSQASSEEEQFGSSKFARVLVRSIVGFSEKATNIIPQRIIDFVDSRFEQTAAMRSSHEGASFDLLRASINLIVASMLIAFGTSHKLPLSTTYVTFIVGMATSLADGAWGRDTAVYRITGVVTVIVGWFLTALIAFTVSLVCVLFLHAGQAVALIFMLGFVGYILVRTQLKKRKKNIAEEQHKADLRQACSQSLDERSLQNGTIIMNDAVSVFADMSDAFSEYSIQKMRKTRSKAIKLDTFAKQMKDTVNITIKSAGVESIDASLNYVQLADYLREIARSSSLVVLPVFDHIDNNHKPLLDEQKKELQEISTRLNAYVQELLEIANSCDFEKMNAFIADQTEMFSFIDGIRRSQIRRAKAAVTNTRNSLLYLQILHETKQMVSYSMNVLKSYRDIVLTLNREKKKEA